MGTLVADFSPKAEPFVRKHAVIASSVATTVETRGKHIDVCIFKTMINTLVHFGGMFLHEPQRTAQIKHEEIASFSHEFNCSHGPCLSMAPMQRQNHRQSRLNDATPFCISRANLVGDANYIDKIQRIGKHQPTPLEGS